MAKGVVLGYLKYVLGFDSLAFEKGLGDADKQLKAAQRALGKTADKFKSIGATMSLAITAPLIGFGATAIKEARETQEAMAQVNAALKSMGPVAGRTADDLKKASDALELSSLYEGDQILRNVTANMLTFGNISGKNFDRAQQAAVDLATRMNMELQPATILVGKALNDPIKGMAALGRAGIQFSKDQKAAIQAMVETGNVAGAQNIILNEFQRQFGGAAQAAQNVDPLNKASDAFKQMAETVGNSLLPLIPVLTDAVVSVANAFGNLSPGMQKIVIIGAAVAAVIGPVLIGISGLISAFGLLLPVIPVVGAALATLAAVVTGTVIPAIGAVIVALSPILVPLAAVAAAVGAVYLAWRNWDKIGPILANLYNGVKLWLMDKISAVFDWLKGKLQAVGDYFYHLWDRVVGHSYVPDMVDAIGMHFARLDTLMVKRAQIAADKTAEIFQKLYSDVVPILDQLFPERVREREYADRYRRIVTSGLEPALQQEAVNRLNKNYSVDSLQPFKGALDGGAKTSFSAMMKEGLGDAFDSIKDHFARTRQFFSDTLRGGFEAVLNGDFRGWFENWWKSALSRVLEKVFDNLGERLANLIGGQRGSGGSGILSAFSSIFGGGSGGGSGSDISSALSAFKSIAGARALGGPVSSGSTYLVGERGPELFTASRSGYIHPNSSAASAQRPVVVQLMMEESANLLPTIKSISTGVSVQQVNKAGGMLRRGRTQSLA